MSNKVTDEEIDALEREAFDATKERLERRTNCTDRAMQVEYATIAARLAEAFAALRGARRAP